MTDTNNAITDGGRTKSELHITICRLARVITNTESQSTLKRHKGAGGKASKVAPAISSPAVVEAPVVVKFELVEEIIQIEQVKEPQIVIVTTPTTNVEPPRTDQLFHPLPKEGDEVEPDVEMPSDCSFRSHPRHVYRNTVENVLVQLPASDKPIPVLDESQFERNSIAMHLARNDFSVGSLDAGFTLPHASNRCDLDLSAIGRALVWNSHLRSLVLACAGISDSDFRNLFSPSVELGHRLGLSVLDLRNNKLGKGSVNLIVSLVSLCPNLRRLSLENNDFSDSALCQIVASLPSGLTSLALTNVSDRVAAAVAKHISSWPHLLEIMLTDGSISASGVKLLAEALQQHDARNAELSRIDLRRNRIENVATLVKLLDVLPALWWVQVAGNPVESSSTILRDTAREKFRIRFSNHPLVELRRVLSNGYHLTSTALRKPLEILCACLSTDVDVSVSSSLLFF